VSAQAEVHLALAQNITKEFVPEEFSLHYQRSLFSSFTTLVRETWQNIEKASGTLPEDVEREVAAFSSRREQMLELLKRIYSKKLDVQKIRIHGNFGLSHILLTGRDILLHDFGGNPIRSYSERRLKRSPLRDVAAMVRSFYNVAYEGFLNTTQAQPEEIDEMLPFADYWAHYMCNFFLKAYTDKVKEGRFVPEERDDFKVLIQTFLLENTLHYFNLELARHPKQAIIPLRIMQTILEPGGEVAVEMEAHS
jgi:maltose alpha-D-glucosyltransferase/alpha-amylase